MLNKLANGSYRTPAGSTVTVSGKHGGIFTVAFDWFEEPRACDSCVVDPIPDGEYLTWACGRCGGGSAMLTVEVAAHA